VYHPHITFHNLDVPALATLNYSKSNNLVHWKTFTIEFGR